MDAESEIVELLHTGLFVVTEGDDGVGLTSAMMVLSDEHPPLVAVTV